MLAESKPALWLVDNTDETQTEQLTREESHATRELAAGTKDEALRKAAAKVILRARSHGLCGRTTGAASSRCRFRSPGWS